MNERATQPERKTRFSKKKAFYTALLLSWFGLSSASAATPLYHLVDTVPLGDPAHWDYLHFDVPSQRLYVSHATEVTVVDTRSDKVLGQLDVTAGSHGVAVDPASGIVWADSAARRLAIAFDPRSLKPIASVKVVLDADGMAYDPFSKQIFNSGGDGNALTPIDPATRRARPDIALGGSPEFFAADGAGRLFVNIVDQNRIVEIDTATDKILASYPTAPCLEPTGMAIDTAKKIIFSSCHSGVMLAMNEDGKILAMLPIGKGTDAAAFDPVRQLAFSANGTGTLTVISDAGASPREIGVVKTPLGARTLAVDPGTGRIYLVTATVIASTPATGPTGHPHYRFAPGSLKLFVYAPGN